MTVEPETVIPPPPAASRPPRSLRAKLAAGRFVVSVEIDPPRGPLLGKAISAATQMLAAGADCINVGDSPMAEARMSAVLAAGLLRERAKVEPIVHFNTRDRNLMALQADLLAAHAMGLRNLLCIKGDDHVLGNYDGARPVHDVNPLGLMRTIKKLNSGRDAIENELSAPTRFYVAAAVNPSAEDLAAEVKLVQRKVRAGADFLISQAVFEVETVERLLEALGPEHPPIIVGIWPVHTVKQADFLNERILSRALPASLYDAIVAAGPDGERCGLEHAECLLEQVRPLVQGVYLIPSFGRFDGIANLVTAARGLADVRA